MTKTIERIRELCPDTMELKFGCFVKSKYHPASTRVIEDYSMIGGSIDTEDGIMETNAIEILGSPITLAVVLRAINSNSEGKLYGCRHSSIEKDVVRFLEYRASEGKTEIYIPLFCEWDLLNDNLLEQSKQTQDFVASCIGVKEG